MVPAMYQYCFMMMSMVRLTENRTDRWTHIHPFSNSWYRYTWW